MEMNQRIRTYIKSHGLTFTHVAAQSGIDVKKFSRMMTGKQRIGTDEYEKICKALNVDPGYFFREKFLKTKNTA